MIAIGCDHAGYRLKLAVIKTLIDRRLEFMDVGCNSADSCDYPDFAEKVAGLVAGGECELGILCCGTGIGMSIAANKINGVRAAACSEPFSAAASRRHNNANILCLGERVVGTGLAGDIVEAFLTAEFEAGRHSRRVEQIEALESR